jgi:hypothetical protein
MANLIDIVGKRLSLAPTAAIKYGAGGAIAGGALSTIKNYPKIINKEISVTDAMSSTFKQSLGTGISSAIGMAVITIIGLEGILATAGIMVVGTLANECLDSISGPRKDREEIQYKNKDLEA